MKPIFFTLSSARSGTLYLKYLFQNNVPGCACRHEPFFDWGNPTLFGRAIYDAFAGRRDRIRNLLEKKRAYVERLSGDLYLESSHAFLKSAYVAALDVFPELRLIHLVRDPVAVARSQAWREMWRRRVHAPFHFYTGDDRRRHFAWALTGNEEIFRCFPAGNLSLFQWYLLEWIEIENRASRFLDEHRLHDRCFTLTCPRDLNDPDRLRQMFEFFDLPTRHREIALAGRKNRSIGYSQADREAHAREADAVLRVVPDRFLEIFSRPSYCDCPWAERLRPRSLRPGSDAQSLPSKLQFQI